MKQLINVKDNLFVTSNQLGWNDNCYDEAGLNDCNDEAGPSSCYNKAGRNSCYNKAGRGSYYDGRIGILLRILRPCATRLVWERIQYFAFQNWCSLSFLRAYLCSNGCSCNREIGAKILPVIWVSLAFNPCQYGGEGGTNSCSLNITVLVTFWGVSLYHPIRT